MSVFATTPVMSDEGDLARLNDAFMRHRNQALALDEMLNPRKKKRAKRRRETEWQKYKKLAWDLTRLQPIHTLPNFDKRGIKSWHLDHVLSISEAFRRGLPAETVAHISNLRMIPAKENMDKGVRTVFTNLFNDAHYIV